MKWFIILWMSLQNNPHRFTSTKMLFGWNRSKSFHSPSAASFTLPLFVNLLQQIRCADHKMRFFFTSSGLVGVEGGVLTRQVSGPEHSPFSSHWGTWYEFLQQSRFLITKRQVICWTLNKTSFFLPEMFGVERWNTPKSKKKGIKLIQQPRI